jgi:hypothetical protein
MAISKEGGQAANQPDAPQTPVSRPPATGGPFCYPVVSQVRPYSVIPLKSLERGKYGLSFVGSLTKAEFEQMLAAVHFADATSKAAERESRRILRARR